MKCLCLNIIVMTCHRQSIRGEMRNHKVDAQADHLQLMVKWLEGTRLKMAETQHLLQEMSNDRGIVESQVQVLTDEVAGLQILSKKTETHSRELQVRYKNMLLISTLIRIVKT